MKSFLPHYYRPARSFRRLLKLPQSLPIKSSEAQMGRGARVIFLTLLLLGCGNNGARLPIGFVNKTEHSDASLWKIWSAAQNSLAAGINLNPVQSSAGARPNMLPGDPRALSVQPHQL